MGASPQGQPAALRRAVVRAVLGAIGVSGAPGGEADDACALAGIKAIADAIEF